MSEILLSVRDLTVTFGPRGRRVSAVDGVSFDVAVGETLGLVGESGCGKSTTGRALMRVVEPTSGTVTLEGVDLTAASGRTLRERRTAMQMIFQDPISSLNPRRRARDIVAEPLDCWKRATGEERRRIVDDLLTQVGIDPVAYGDRYARQFSGGQCQRISIARALAMRPKLLICDEVVSALDVSVQAQILNLLGDIQRQRGIAFLFITHDLAVVRNVADRIAVLRQGRVVESGTVCDVLEHPSDPYTQALLAAVPDPFRTIGVARLPASEATGGSR